MQPVYGKNRLHLFLPHYLFGCVHPGWIGRCAIVDWRRTQSRKEREEGSVTSADVSQVEPSP